MQLTPENLKMAFTTYNAAYLSAYTAAPREMPPYAGVVPSTTSAMKYPIMIFSTTMKPWEGSYKIDELKFDFLMIENKDHKAAVEVNRNDLEDDQIGIYVPLFTALGTTAANHWGEMAAERLIDPNLWADNQPFFGTHKIGKSTFRNTITGALSKTTFLEARAAMRAFKAPDGVSPMRIRPDTLIVGPALEMTARAIVEREFEVEDGSTVDNLAKGMAKVYVEEAITDDTWYLAQCDGPFKPFIVSKRKEGSLVALDQEKDAPVYQENKNQYEVHNRGESGGVLPQLIVRGKPA